MVSMRSLQIPALDIYRLCAAVFVFNRLLRKEKRDGKEMRHNANSANYKLYFHMTKL